MSKLLAIVAALRPILIAASAAFGRRLKIVNKLVKRYGLTDRLCA